MLETSQKDRLKLFIHRVINHGLKSKVFYGSHKHWSHGTDFVTSILYDHLVFLSNSIPAENWHIFYIYKLTIAGEKTKILQCFII
jgi:hypothetical protein